MDWNHSLQNHEPDTLSWEKKKSWKYRAMNCSKAVMKMVIHHLGGDQCLLKTLLGTVVEGAKRKVMLNLIP